MDEAEDICHRLEALDGKLLRARRRASKAGTKHASWGHPELSLPQVTRSTCSAGFYKMLEMSPYLPHSLQRVTCLCEAPGGFAQAITLLHPECIVSAASMSCHIEFSPHLPRSCRVWRGNRPPRTKACHSSDIRDASVRMALVKWRYNQDAVTADGGTFCHDHDDAEALMFSLMRAQAEVGTTMLRMGGCLLLKFLQGTNPATRVLLARLEVSFSSVQVVKPLSSRRWNSERYVVCRGKRAELGRSTQQCSVELLRSLELTAWGQICGLADKVFLDADGARQKSQELRERYVALIGAVLPCSASATSELISLPGR